MTNRHVALVRMTWIKLGVFTRGAQTRTSLSHCTEQSHDDTPIAPEGFHLTHYNLHFPLHQTYQSLLSQRTGCFPKVTTGQTDGISTVWGGR